MRRPFYYIASVLPESILPLLIQKTGKKLCCVYYHMVSDREELHINKRYVYRNRAMFEQDLDFLLRYFQPISWQQAIHYKGDKPAMLLSFDDGFRCFYEVVAPILQSRSIPSICFVNSAFTDNKELLKICSQNLAMNGIYDTVKYLETEHPYMTSDQIRQLYAEGIAIGAHSIDHPHFKDIDDQEQIHQIKESLRFVQEECGVKERLFSFPYGQEGASLQTLQWAAENCDLVMGTANLKDEDFGIINRIWMEGYHISARNIIIGEYIREWIHQIK